MESQNVQSERGVKVSGPSRYAVLVGCNYPNTENELHGCVNDITRMRTTLLERFGFSQDNIHILVDTDPAMKQPSKANIMESLQSMIGKASSGDVLLFHYSGHGTRVPRPGDDTGYDECIVPCDLELIADDYFRALVKQLPKGTSFTVISDSCHSGGLIDKEKEQIGPNHKARTAAVQKEARVATKLRFIKPEALKSRPRQTDANGTVLKEKVDPDMGILLSGCQSDETSADACPSGDLTKAFGAFSDALQQVLAMHPGPISNKDLVIQASKILGQDKYHQHPCLYCSDANADATFLLQPKLEI